REGCVRHGRARGAALLPRRAPAPARADKPSARRGPRRPAASRGDTPPLRMPGSAGWPAGALRASGSASAPSRTRDEDEQGAIEQRLSAAELREKRVGRKESLIEGPDRA